MILKPVGLLGAGSGVDPYAEDVILLLPFSGANDEQLFPDYTEHDRVQTIANTSAKTLTNDYKFYGSSAYFPGGTLGELGYGVGLPATDDFTVEFWAKQDGADGAGGGVVLGIYPGSLVDGRYFCAVINEGASYFFVGGAFSEQTSANTSLNWHHYRFVRDGLKFYAFVDGGLVFTSDDETQALITNAFQIGMYGDNSGYSFKGWVNDLRVTLAARSTQSFTPPGALAVPDTGTITDYTEGETSYREIRFTKNGTLTLAATTEVEYLLIGGGGGGGGYFSGGGGGAGGVISGTMELEAGTYPVVIGASGTGGGLSDNAGSVGKSGGASTALGLTALGGGGGGGTIGTTGLNGGSGGGGGNRASTAGGTGTSGQGYAGGIATTSTTGGRGAGGGGGGASEVGANAPDTCTGGDGGDGIEWPAGSGDYYAGGGGGGAATGVAGAAGAGGLGGGGAGGRGAGNAGQHATQSTGSGGGGGGNTTTTASIGGRGGSGLFVIRYVLP